MKVLIQTTLVFALIAFSRFGQATQDVESPYDVLAYLRMLLVEPEISQEIVKYGERGCVWTSQVIWGGSPTESDLATGIFWKTLSMQFTNSSGQDMWVQFAFSTKDGRLVESKNVTDNSKSIDCTK